MALETVVDLDDLNTSNPTSGDPKSQGDDHLRNLKTALKTDFPNITGPVTVTQTDLNKVTKIPGVDQTWQDVSASRAINTNYTNSTSKPIMVAVSVSGTTNASTVSLGFTVDGVSSIGLVSLITGTTAANTTISASVLVPPGSTYRAVVTQGAVQSWNELR